MKDKLLNKLIAIIMIVIVLFPMIGNFAYATEINKANLYEKGNCGFHLQYWNERNNKWSYVTCTYIVYNQNGIEYPAYCLNKELPGVEEVGDYTVNIENLLDNVQVWRTIINGYPYKTPSEMGVYDEYDAFIATKQAIYSILYNYDPVTKYRGGDERGTKIAKAICNLVNIGKNGTQTPYTAGITANKIGDFTEDGQYYSQEYSIDTSVETSQYTITNILGLPSGGIITDMLGNEKNTFLATEHFKIKIPKLQLNNDINLIVNLQAKCKTYPVFYGKTTIPGTQDYAITYDPFGDVAGNTIFNIKTNTGKIKINKIDSETSKPIQGVTFQLQKQDGTIVANATTNSDGEATFGTLYQGNYILKEIATNDNYVISEMDFNVNVEFNKTTEITVTNEHKKGDLTLYKVDKDNNKIALGGVVFDLYSEELQKVIGTYTTDENGEIHIKGLRIGNYTWIEKETNKWYNLAEDKKTEVIWDKNTTNTIENELKKGQIKVIKVDKDNNEIKLENVKFKVMDENGNLLEELITDKNGEAITSKYPIRDFEKLKIQEVETLDDYFLNDNIETIILEENQIKDVVFENEKIKGQIQVIKISADDNELTGDKKGTPLAGARFNILDKEGNIVDTLITGEDGKALSKELIKGEYKVVEVDSGSPYYLVNSEEFNVEIKEHKKIVDVTVEEESVDIEVEVEKTGFKETQSKDTIYYDFSNIINKSNVALDNFTWKDTLPTNALTANRIYTGTWNEELTYSVWYKTNLSDEYIMLVDGLSTTVNNEVKFTDVELKEGEFITEYEFRFGTVKSGFREIEKPRLYCDMKDGLGNGFVFTNHTMVSGTYFDKYVEDKDDWTTITYYKEIELEQKLPKTGNIDNLTFIEMGIILIVNVVILILNKL